MTCLLGQVPGALRMLPWASAGARAGGRVDAPCAPPRGAAWVRSVPSPEIGCEKIQLSPKNRLLFLLILTGERLKRPKSVLNFWGNKNLRLSRISFWLCAPPIGLRNPKLTKLTLNRLFFRISNKYLHKTWKYRFFGGKSRFWVEKSRFGWKKSILGGSKFEPNLIFGGAVKSAKFFGVQKSKVLVRNPKFFL